MFVSFTVLLARRWKVRKAAMQRAFLHGYNNTEFLYIKYIVLEIYFRQPSSWMFCVISFGTFDNIQVIQELPPKFLQGSFSVAAVTSQIKYS